MSEFKSKLEQTRKKLLDLTKRNKLINYKRPSKTRNSKIIDESPEFIYQHLVFDETPFKFKFIKEPEILQLENNKLLDKKAKLEKVKQSTIYDGEKKAAENQIQGIFEQLQENKADALLTAEEQAEKLGFITSSELPDINLEAQNIDDKYTDDYLQTLHYPSDLEKILKKIELNARSIIQETGANMLYLILGVLEWKESNNSEIKIKSPLINIPVTLRRGSLNRKTNTYEYILEYDGASIDTNKSLAEKLKNDFNILLPELTEELSFNEYMTEVKKICNNKKEWKIKQEISLDFLQFSKILMYKDLDTDNWDNGALENNQVLQDIFLGKEISGVSYSPEEYDIDNNKVALNTPLIMDADSSQHSAIVDVLEGKNVVIEGPPGTGKSQTISNMIAALIADGKSVLFVSEKLAALDVVSKRLASNQLGDFCLELHSHKTQKLKVLESLKIRIEGEYYPPSELERVKQELESRKSVLRKYIDILHLKHGNTNKKIFETFWLVEKYQEVEKYLKFKIIDSESFEVTGINNRVEELHKYQAYVNNYDFNTFYWNGFELNNLQFIDIEMFIDDFKNINIRYKNLISLYSKLNIDLENEIQESNNISILLAKLEEYNIQNVNQELLHQLVQNNLSVFENYLLLSLKQIEVKKANKIKIIGYDSMSKDDVVFIRNLNDKILKKIEKKYINKRNRYEELRSELTKYINLERYSINNELLNQLISIDNFLYKDIEVAKIEEINLINSKLVDNLSKIERIIRDSSSQIGISKTYNIYEIGIINNGLQLLNEIDQSLYINCIDIIGTTRYVSIIETAIKEESILKDLKDNLEIFTSIDNINSINIQKLEQIKTDLIDKKDSLFKIFSGVFKQAKTDYSLLLKVSIPENSDTWIEHLSSIITSISKKEQYENSLSYCDTFQDLFQGLDTDWDKITKLNDWASTVRKEVKSNELLNILLSGNEQSKLSASSYAIELNDNLKIFNDLIQNVSELYEKSFIKKLYYHIEDINILELKDKLEIINDNINNYQLVIQKYEIDNYIKIEKLINLINEFLDSKESYKIGKEGVYSLISEIIDSSEQIDINSYIDTLLSFLKEQQYPIAEVSRLLTEEATISTELISVVNMIKEDFNFNLLETNEELEQLQSHINIIADVNNSPIFDSLKISLINDFFNTYEILKDIKNESGLASAQMNELIKYGEFKSNLFYNKQTSKYIDLSNKLNSIDNNIDNLSIWLDYKNLLAKIKGLGLIKIIEAIESDVLPKELIITAYYYNFYNSLLRTTF